MKESVVDETGPEARRVRVDSDDVGRVRGPETLFFRSKDLWSPEGLSLFPYSPSAILPGVSGWTGGRRFFLFISFVIRSRTRSLGQTGL